MAILHSSLFLADVEGHTNVDRYFDIIFGGASFNRSIKLYCILCDHGSNSLVGAITAKVARVHLAIGFAPNVLQGDNTVGHVQLIVAATGRVYDDHDRDTFQVLVADETRALIRVVSVQLDQVSSLSDLALYLIIQLISVSLVCHIPYMNILLIM